MADIVSIRDLRVPAVIGVHGWEREAEQTLTVAVQMPADAAAAAATDDLAGVLDYSQVAGEVRDVLAAGRFRLIETAAEAVAQALTARFGVEWVRVEIAKPIRGEGYTAAVAVERGRHPARLL